MNMSYEMLGIIATFVITGCVFAVAGASMIDIELNDSLEVIDKIAITSSTSTVTSNAYYEWCYKMNFNCG